MPSVKLVKHKTDIVVTKTKNQILKWTRHLNPGAYEYEYIIDMHQYPIVFDTGFWLVLIDHWSKIEVESGDRISKK